MTPIEELNKTINELAKIKERAEERYQDALERLAIFYNDEQRKISAVLDVVMIADVLGYETKKKKNDLFAVMKRLEGKNERITVNK